MTFIRTIPPEEAEGKVKEMYDADIKDQGYIANGTKAMKSAARGLPCLGVPSQNGALQNATAPLRTGNHCDRIRTSLHVLTARARGVAP